ncbi:MAG: AAA family ATPase, partial [Elusimicrobiota bacterium]|nr:AAA family ATPase [Elusimicrobiota bacterium]
MNNLEQLRDLPLDCQDFRELRELNLVYVDKTEQICKMVKKNKYYFLARP